MGDESICEDCPIRLHDEPEEMEYCEECNNPLSACGRQNVDGEPSMDCRVCQLTDRIAALDKHIGDLDYQIEYLKSRTTRLELKDERNNLQNQGW